MRFLAVLFVLCLFSSVQLASIQHGCPGGLGTVNCLIDPCQIPSHTGCAGYPNAQCKSNYCGGCNAEWYDTDGSLVFCHA